MIHPEQDRLAEIRHGSCRLLLARCPIAFMKTDYPRSSVWCHYDGESLGCSSNRFLRRTQKRRAGEGAGTDHGRLV